MVERGLLQMTLWIEMISDEIHDETNILYNYTIPITIPILECIL